MLCRYIPKAVNKPPYANGTAMVGDSVMYTWKGFFHGVVLSTSCEPRLPICCFSVVSQYLAASWHDSLSPSQHCNILLQAFDAGTLPLC